MSKQLQTLYYALNAGKVKYDRMCYMIRSTAFKAYNEGGGISMICCSIENGLMYKHCEELDAMNLPFNCRYIPIDYPQPEVYM